MSLEALQNAIAAKLERQAPEVEQRKTEIKKNLFGPDYADWHKNADPKTSTGGDAA
ncbi:hypothetical protein [Micromonospora sp. Mcm103]|uniref:hypothetical protein n=1 Tax=Micromonospora sp. Mcm103 TaxID=2926015 RepID=UPI0021CA25BE|nr:hypothetical protein [Micromonospora sp. Mcm103]